MKSATYSSLFLAGRHVPMPRHLIIEITSVCNLRCRMCPKTHHTVNTAENKVMPWEVFEKLFPLLPHIESLDLTGVWGEAFLHPKLYMDMLKKIKSKGSDVYTISNGTLITDDLARQLVENDLNKLTISLDAATPETYAVIRPPGHFEDVLNGIRSIGSWKKKLSRTQPRVELAFVGMKSNIEEFPRAVKLAGELGAEQICLQAMGEYPGLENESVAAHHKALGRQIFEDGQRVGTELDIQVLLLPEDQFQEDHGDRNLVEDHGGQRKECYDLWNKALIAATGDVLPCCSSPVSMGNLKDKSFEEIWRGEAYNDLRRHFIGGEIPEMCKHCTGTAWVPQSSRRDLRFFFSGLLLPRVKRRVKRRLRQAPALRWIKGKVDASRK